MHVPGTRRFPLIVALATLGAVLAACGGASAAGNAAAQASGAQAKKKSALVKLRKTSLGKVLVDVRGRTLYLYTPDRKNKSTCYGGCATAWPPLLTTGKPRAGAGLKKSLLGVTMRTDGKHQVTYAGHPLYFFASDTKAGQTNGQDVGGVWYVVSAAGKKLEKQAAVVDTTTTNTTTTDKSGYGNGY
jgi:predicted lipoprotein with Yx(FWY)xxD motif